MARATKPDGAAIIASLELKITDEETALDAVKARQRIALIGIEQGKQGAEQEADALAQGVRARKDRIQALRETLDEARKAQIVNDGDTIDRAAAKELAASQDRVRNMLDAAKELDAVIVLVGERYHAFFEAHVAFWQSAPVDARKTSLVDYMQGHSAVKPLIRLRLGFEGALDGEMIWDRTEQPETIEHRMTLALGDHVPKRGRPAGSSTEKDSAND